jgi:hypothetical protein
LDRCVSGRGNSAAHGTPRDTADIAGDAGLVQARVHDADSGGADADPRRNTDPRGAYANPGRTHADVSCSTGLVEARIADADTRCTDAGRDAGTGGADADAGVRRRGVSGQDDHQGADRKRARPGPE